MILAGWSGKGVFNAGMLECEVFGQVGGERGRGGGGTQSRKGHQQIRTKFNIKMAEKGALQMVMVSRGRALQILTTEI